MPIKLAEALKSRISANFDTLNTSQDPEYEKLFYYSRVNLYALPAAFLMAYVLHLISFSRTLTVLLVRIPLHELGHALIATMGGRFAVPLGSFVPTAGLTLIGDERHIIISLGALILFLFGAAWGFKRKNYFILYTSILMSLGVLFFSFFIDNQNLENYISFSGIAGEFFFGALLVLSFYFPLTQRFRWDFWRYPVLLIGALSFTHTYIQWINIKNKIWPLPLGTGISTLGARDPHGDLNRLLADNWTEYSIIERYLNVGKIGLIVIILHYIFFFLLAPGIDKTQDSDPQ